MARLLDTFPKLLARHAAEHPDQIALREKDFGIWQSITWAEYQERVKRCALGLYHLGVARGDVVGLIGDNRPDWVIGEIAAHALGAMSLGLYRDALEEEVAYLVNHASVTVVLVEDEEQVDKLLAVREAVPRLATIVFDDARGMRNYAEPGLVSLQTLQTQGRDLHAREPGRFEAEIAKGKGSDVSVMLYTSGTTGTPKGVILTYDNVVTTARNGVAFDKLTEQDVILAYLPMAWVGDHIYSYAESLVSGFCIACPESGATVLTDLREVGPSFFFAPPRIYENLLTTVSIRMEDAGAIKRRMYRFFMEHARRVGIPILEGKPVSLIDRTLYAAGELLVYGPLKNTLGLTRMRTGYTAGEAIGPDIFDFFRSIGLNLKQLYGMTEASVFICMQPDGQIRADTVGPPAPDVEVRIADTGEVLVRSPGVFQTYFKNEAATRETKTADGWLRTGDAGYFDELGHLKIIDRAKDVGRLTDGTLFAPKYIENKLKFFSYIKEAVAFGDGRDAVTAFICIDLAAVGNWAERHNLAYASYQELAAKPEVYDLIADCVARVNRDLAADAKLAGSQLRRFLVLHKELDADDGELTRTRKVRRRFIGERYEPLVGALYSGATQAHIETTVKFEDGRSGLVKADLAIRDMAPQSAAPLRKAG